MHFVINIEKIYQRITPPTFLVHASNEKGVNPINSVVFYDLLICKRVPAEFAHLPTGGHGFGMDINKSKASWMESCKSWMQLNGWLK